MTKIEWTEKTLNVITGCTPISEGCQNCYAKKMHSRLRAMGQKKYNHPFGEVIHHHQEDLQLFAKLGKSKMVFLNSMSDTFHKDIPNVNIKSILELCNLANKHTFQVLTKRAERLPDFEYPENVWLGVTVELAKYKQRIDELRKTNAKVKFLSCEPLLGDLGELDLTGIDWVIVGGESGHNARPMHPDWVRNIQRQCEKQGVPFFFKQWGEWCPANQIDEEFAKNNFNVSSGLILNVQINHETGSYLIGKKRAGSLLDGREYKEFPKEVQ